MMELGALGFPGWAGLVEILALAILFYYALLFFQGTRGAPILVGFVVAIFVLLLTTKLTHLDTLNWILKQFFAYLTIAFVVIFQPEIRRVLSELGRQPSSLVNRSMDRGMIEHIIDAILLLANQKIGALVAIERGISLQGVQETGTVLDSAVSSELLATIFYPHTPLHDGGVVVREDRLMAAGCLFPLSQRSELSKSLGTRHRAAIGLTEETDSIVLVVSEETGTISLAYKGRLSRGLDEDRLQRMLHSLLSRGKKTASRFSRAKEQLDLSPAGVARMDSLIAAERQQDVS